MRCLKEPARSWSRAGFTLIEMIAVLLLFGVLTAVALFFTSRSPATVVAEADLLAAHLRYTQIRALGDVEPWRLEITDNNTYQIERVGDSPVRIPGEPSASRDLVGGVSLASPPDEIRFDAWGRPVSAANAPLNNNVTLTLTDGDNEAAITITAGTGLIR